MRIKTQPDASDVLCPRCHYGLVWERRDGERVTQCDYVGRTTVVPGDIVRCNEFLDRNRVSRHDMEKIAWVIRHDKSGRITGFQPPKRREPINDE